MQYKYIFVYFSCSPSFVFLVIYCDWLTNGYYLLDIQNRILTKSIRYVRQLITLLFYIHIAHRLPLGI